MCPMSVERVEAHCQMVAKYDPVYEAVLEYANEMLERENIQLTEPLKLTEARATYQYAIKKKKEVVTHRIQFGKRCIRDVFRGEHCYWCKDGWLRKIKLSGPRAIFSLIVEELSHAKNFEDEHDSSSHGYHFKVEWADMAQRNLDIYHRMLKDKRFVMPDAQYPSK